MATLQLGVELRLRIFTNGGRADAEMARLVDEQFWQSVSLEVGRSFPAYIRRDKGPEFVIETVD